MHGMNRRLQRPASGFTMPEVVVGVALLAILDDPGTDSSFVRARLAEIESNLPRMLTLGVGDAGCAAYVPHLPGCGAAGASILPAD